MSDVLGLDLSLTATGWATADGHGIITSRGRGIERCREIAYLVIEEVSAVGATLVAVEGYAFSARNSQAHALGELGGIVRDRLLSYGVPWVDVPPAVVKKWATGKGNAPKGLVLVEAVKRLGYTGSDHNVADALWLREVGLALLGASHVEVPKVHMAALAKLRLPAGVAP